MSPLPLARRYVLSQTAVQPTLFLSEKLLDDADHRDTSQIVTVTVTVTKWYTTPSPTSGVMPWMSRDAIIPSTTEPPAIPRPTSEMFNSPTATAVSGSGASSGTSFRSSLVAGIVGGLLTIIAAGVLFVFWRRRRCVHAALRIGHHGCRSERPSVESAWGARDRPSRNSALWVTPYDVDEAPPPYETSERKAYVILPEPVLVRQGTAQQNAYGLGEDQSRSPSTVTTYTPSTLAGTIGR